MRHELLVQARAAHNFGARLTPVDPELEPCRTVPGCALEWYHKTLGAAGGLANVQRPTNGLGREHEHAHGKFVQKGCNPI